MLPRKMKGWMHITLISFLVVALMSFFRLHEQLHQKFSSKSDIISRNPIGDATTCEEVHDVVFIKVHKTGSTTLANIINRFGESKNLIFAIPNKRPGEPRYNYVGNIGDTVSLDNIMPSKAGIGRYNILVNHVIFNKTAFKQVFYPDTRYITLLREPISQFISSVLFFVHQNETFNAVTSNFTSYLLDPSRFEPPNAYLSFTNNRQALDLGVPSGRLHEINFIRHYIQMLDDTFHLVLILEYFDESLVLLKRKFCWTLQNIVYLPINKGYKKVHVNITETDRMLHRKWAIADFFIYDHFKQKLLDLIQQEDGFQAEVIHFKAIVKSVVNFCEGGSQELSVNVPGSRWNGPFNINAVDCIHMALSEITFLDKLHKRVNNLSEKSVKKENLP